MTRPVAGTIAEPVATQTVQTTQTADTFDVACCDLNCRYWQGHNRRHGDMHDPTADAAAHVVDTGHPVTVIRSVRIITEIEPACRVATPTVPGLTGPQVDHLRSAAAGALYVNDYGLGVRRAVRHDGKVNQHVVERLRDAGLIVAVPEPGCAALYRYELAPGVIVA